MTKILKAYRDLMDAGPGGICAECGHFALRHGNGFCDGFPDKPCTICKGMLWQGVRIPIVNGKPDYLAAVLDRLNHAEDK